MLFHHCRHLVTGLCVATVESSCGQLAGDKFARLYIMRHNEISYRSNVIIAEDLTIPRMSITSVYGTSSR